MENVTQKLDFGLKKAVEFIMTSGNHHISWQIVHIVYESFGQELIYKHYVQCKKEEVNPSRNLLVDWCGSSVKRS